MFKKILYGTDFSDLAANALQYVKTLIQHGVKDIVVLHVLDEYQLGAISAWASGTGVISLGLLQKAVVEQKKIAQQKLKKIKTQLETQDVKVTTLLKTGIPHNEIVETAEQEDVSLIIIGSHGKGFLKSAIMGSVSENVLRNTNRPILMVKQQNS